jgi:hypothetical protein
MSDNTPSQQKPPEQALLTDDPLFGIAATLCLSKGCRFRGYCEDACACYRADMRNAREGGEQFRPEATNPAWQGECEGGLSVHA